MMFQPRVDGIIEYIDEQLRIASDYNVTHLVLAGGLCGSRYVQQQINNLYGGRMHILITDIPEIAVAKGLVLNRIMEIRYQLSILETSRPTLSYGVIPSYLSHHSSLLMERHSRKNPYHNKNWESNIIDWLVVCNEPVDRSKPILKSYDRYFDFDEIPPTGKEVWRDTIIMSYAPERRRLPYSDDEGDAKEVYEIESVLDRQHLESLEGVSLRTDKHIFHKNQKYYVVKTTLAVQIGVREIHFEIKVGTQVIGEGAVDIKWNLAKDTDSGFEDETKPRKTIRDANRFRALFRNS
jgi:hypothetical protein